MEYSYDGEKRITLMYVLQLIENHIDAENLYWSILFLYVIGYTYDPYSVNNISSVDEFEETIRTTKGGYKLSWKELKKLCGQFENIVDCVIVGSKSNEDIDYIAERCKNDFDVNIKMNYIGIDILDGSMEGFYSKDKALEEAVCNDIGPFPFGIHGNI
jgi:hypothetical protein